MGWLPNRLPATCGLALERGAGLSGLPWCGSKEVRALADPVLDFDGPCGALPGMRMAVCVLPADVGLPCLCETVN